MCLQSKLCCLNQQKQPIYKEMQICMDINMFEARSSIPKPSFKRIHKSTHTQMLICEQVPKFASIRQSANKFPWLTRGDCIFALSHEMASSRVYIGRLPYRARERDVEDFFKGYGRIREILLKNGFGFVEFDDPRDADDAVYHLNGRELCGERIIVEMTKRPPKGRDAFRSSYRGSYGSRGFSPERRRRDRDDKYGPPSQTPWRCIVSNVSTRVSWQHLRMAQAKCFQIFFSTGNVFSSEPNLADNFSARSEVLGTDAVCSMSTRRLSRGVGYHIHCSLTTNRLRPVRACAPVDRCCTCMLLCKKK
ncbi:splicing factor, arginine/serine-rich 6 [Trichinella spiralis]|uniref:splicing factor, arginine/serine-rich 6 n=1 Tax=Trichinella spiralis TaxID=6334 RepID=UPI0001EFCCE8|nr:splicing factor, arginine/serine-rich 6 [Trichinella spiralis]